MSGGGDIVQVYDTIRVVTPSSPLHRGCTFFLIFFKYGKEEEGHPPPNAVVTTERNLKRNIRVHFLLTPDFGKSFFKILATKIV